jgi:hypothetical protein
VLIVAIAGVVLYFYPSFKASSEPPAKTDEFRTRCILKQGDCSYIFLLNYLDENPEIKDAEVKTVLMEKYRGAKATYANKQLNEEGFSSDASFQFILKVFKILDQKEKGFWLGKILGMKKTTWQGTHIQQYCLSLMGYATVDKVNVTNSTLKNLLKTNVCNLLPTTGDLTESPGSDFYTCYVYDYMRVKQFCKSLLSEDEKTIMRDTLGLKYTDPIAVDCQKRLQNLRSML